MVVWVVVAMVVGSVSSLPSLPASLEQDIAQVHRAWSHYRNMVDGGFFFNDSLIVLADYGEEETNTEDVSDQQTDEEVEVESTTPKTEKTGDSLASVGLEQVHNSISYFLKATMEIHILSLKHCILF